MAVSPRLQLPNCRARSSGASAADKAKDKQCNVCWRLGRRQGKERHIGALRPGSGHGACALRSKPIANAYRASARVGQVLGALAGVRSD